METSIVKLSPELLSLFAGGGNANTLVPFSREVFLLDITVAGTTHCPKIDDVFPQLQVGSVLKMQRDPNNKYDEAAIGVWYNDVRIGWVPQAMNTVISRLMDAGKAFFCRVTELDGESHGSWKKIDGKIYMVE